MTPKVALLYEGFRRRQDDPMRHPLTCSGGGGPGDHAANLNFDSHDDFGITLGCPICTFTQTIPVASPLGEMLMADATQPVRSAPWEGA